MVKQITDVLIIVNPRSGKNRVHLVLQDARRSLWGRNIKIATPATLDELAGVIQSVDLETTGGIVVVGGDGTFHQVLRRLPSFPNQVPLVPFPSGTANDFAMELGIQNDWSLIQRLLDTQSVETVDVVTANGVPFVTTAGIGLGSDLTQVFNTARAHSKLIQISHRFLGQGIYHGLAAATILGRQKFARKIRVRANNFDEQLTAAAVFVCNQSALAGSLRVAPKIDNDDDRFNVLVIPHGLRLALVMQMIQMSQQRLPEGFFSFSSRELEIRSLDGKPLRVFGDGEHMIEDRNIQFIIETGRLRVLRPPSSTGKQGRFGKRWARPGWDLGGSL